MGGTLRSPYFSQGGALCWLMPELYKGQRREAGLCPRVFPRPGSVIGHYGEGSELAQPGLVLPLPLLVGAARLV